jgi:hypothetical protein
MLFFFCFLFCCSVFLFLSFLCFAVTLKKFLSLFFLLFNLNKSADKVKRLSLIVDKQEAIKTFLSGITEEENEEENAYESTATNVATGIEKNPTINTATCSNKIDLGHNIGESSTDENDCMKAPTMDDQNTNKFESKFELDPRFSGEIIQENEFDDTARKNLISTSFTVSFIYY